jgi:hypothetical protein
MLVAALVMMPVVAFAGGESEVQSAAPVVTPRIDYLEGNVSVNGLTAFPGMEVAPGSTVVVDQDSLCEVTFGRNILRIYPGTSAVIDVGEITSRVSVNTGAVAAVLDKLETVGNDARLRFETPTAVGGVRGTTFYVRVEDPDTTFVCVCNGTVELASALGTGERIVSVAHHSGVRFRRESNGEIAASIPEMAYHTDEEMEDLASRIGVEIDWSAPM